MNSKTQSNKQIMYWSNEDDQSKDRVVRKLLGRNCRNDIVAVTAGKHDDNLQQRRTL